jgi:hypothetical protein
VTTTPEFFQNAYIPDPGWCNKDGGDPEIIGGTSAFGE